MIVERIKKLHFISQEIDDRKEYTKRVEAKAYYPTNGENRSLATNIIGYMEMIAKLKNDIDVLQHELEFLQEALNTLNNPEREVMLNRFWLGLTVEETAKKIHYSSKTVKNMTKKAFTSLEKRFS